ncbi:MAG: AAA family ATPase [Acetobacteraceae bacterium]|nr:AAA family ATPase [Acetobacteraceae bacterium]
MKDDRPARTGPGHSDFLAFRAKLQASRASARPSEDVRGAARLGMLRENAIPVAPSRSANAGSADAPLRVDSPIDRPPRPDHSHVLAWRKRRSAGAGSAIDQLPVEPLDGGASGRDAANGPATGAVPVHTELPNAVTEPAEHAMAATGATAAAANDEHAVLAGPEEGPLAEVHVVSAESDRADQDTAAASASAAANAPLAKGDPDAVQLPRLFISARDVEATIGINTRRPIFGDFLTSGNVGILAGPPGCGKSIYAANVIAAVATGKAFAGDAVDRPHKVVVWAAEDGHAETLRRIYAAARAIGGDLDLIRENVIFVNRTEDLFLVQRDAGRGLALTTLASEFFKQIKLFGAGMAVFDPMTEFNGGNENDNGEMLFFVSALREMARSSGCAVLVVHHSVKAKEPRTTLPLIRGAGALGAAARSARGVSEMTKDECAGFKLTSGDERDVFRVDDIKNSYARRGNGGRFFLRETVQEHGIDTPIIRQIFKEKSDNK